MNCTTLFLALMFLKSVVGFSSLNDEPQSDSQHCVCVPYWQCKEDFSGLIEDGIDIIDIRLLRRSRSRDSSAPCTGDFDVCCQVECGKRRNVVSIENRMQHVDEEVFGFRILGDNNEAEFGEFPWMLGVLDGQTYRCGASLIHPKVALTAAHCVSGKGQYKIRAGEWNWESKTEPLPHQDKMTEKIIIHPRFHRGSLRNDIALLILESPFRLSENVGLACLPPQSMQFDHKNCVASGWGKNSFRKGTYQPTLKKTELPIVPREQCMKALQDARLGPMFNLHYSFICAGGEANKDTCKGDGGSPLVCPVLNQPGRYEQVGIVSWGLTCGVQNTPGVYVNVALFSEWIDKQMLLHNLDVKIYRY